MILNSQLEFWMATENISWLIFSCVIRREVVAECNFERRHTREWEEETALLRDGGKCSCNEELSTWIC
jgi:hypothetical protein